MAKMGRPKTPEYRKRSMRFSLVEDSIKPIIKSFESEEDKIKIMRWLDGLKSCEVKKSL